jgi:putative transcriptional regulator
MKRIRCKLDEILTDRNMDNKTLHRLSGVREATIGEMRRDVNKTFVRESLEKIVNVLEINDISELLEIVDEENEKGAN